MKVNTGNKRNLLTILVEDYFHVGAFENLIQKRNWTNFEARYERNTHKVLDLLDEYGTKATFFVLGWIAEQNPAIVVEISKRGHEIASRGYFHRSLRQLTHEEIREDLKRTKGVLESSAQHSVIGYRSAEKLSYESDFRMLEILAEEGYAYDASFLPTRKTERHKRFAHQFHHGGRIMWEFPYSTRNLGLGLLPISGGNYLRQIPYTIMRSAVRDWTERYDEPFIFYMHVWELDPEQPRISAASRYNRIRHYRKLDKMEWILQEHLELYSYTSVADFLGLRESPEFAKKNATGIIDSPLGAVREPARTPSEKVTIVIPCYNESESINYLVNTLRGVREELGKNGYDAEVVFVDDCSTDGTHEKLVKLFGDKQFIQILKHDTNQGVAAGILTGLRAAKSEIVCSMDCDCTYDPYGLVDMIPLLKDGVDMVTASPYHPEGEVRNVPAWRLSLSKGASFLYRRVLGSKLSTYTSCFRVYRKSSVAAIEVTEKGFLGVAELLGRLDVDGGTIVEYPATLEVRLFGISKMKTVRTIGGHLKLLSTLAKERIFRKNRPITTSLEEKPIKTSGSKISGK